MALTLVHTKTLIAPSTGTQDKVYGADYVSASSHSFAGGTSTAVLFVNSSGQPDQDATNFLYTTTSGPMLQVGSGSGTSQGIKLSYGGLSGFSVITNTGVASPDSASAGVVLSSGGAQPVYLQSGSGGDIYFRHSSTLKAAFLGVAGSGLTITAGTATTDVQALSVTQTWNAAGVAFVHEKHVITDTASAAGSLAVQYLGGAAGTTNLFKVSKAGLVDAPAYSVGGAAGASFGPGAVTSITVVNGIITAIS